VGHSDPVRTTGHLSESSLNMQHQSVQLECIEPSESTTQSLPSSPPLALSPDHERASSKNSERKTYGFDTGGIDAFLVEERVRESPMVVDALDVVPEYQVIEKRKRRKRSYVYGGIAILVIILVLLIAVIGRIKTSRGGQAKTDIDGQFTNPPSRSPSALPTMMETKTEPSAKLISIIQSQYDDIAEFNSVFSNEATPQFRAAVWVEESGGSVMSDARIVNRFALATFYFATNGDGWTKCGRQSNHCSVSQEWLTAENECEWYGIQCNDDGSEITALNFPQNRERQHKIIGTLPYELSFLSNLAMVIIPSKSNYVPPNITNRDILKGISGRFPDWSKLTTLTHLLINDHQLEGPFPTYLLENNSALKTIEFTNSSFQGQLFQDISSVKSTALETIRLGGNNFTGPIWPEVNELSTLKTLDISRNRFTGILPDELLTLVNLTLLDFSDNAFTGTITSGFETLAKLRTLKLHSNDIIGSVPKELCDRKEDESAILRTITVDCTEVPAKVSCMCCNNCPLNT